MVVESTFPNTQIETHSEIENLLINKNYLFAYADGLNRFYVSVEHQELLPSLKYPPNVFDDYQTFSEFTAVKNADETTRKFEDYKQQVLDSVLNNSSIISAITTVQEHGNELNSLLDVLHERTKNLDELAANVGGILGHLNSTRQYDELIQKVAKLSAENERVHIAYDALSKVHETSLGHAQILNMKSVF